MKTKEKGENSDNQHCSLFSTTVLLFQGQISLVEELVMIVMSEIFSNINPLPDDKFLAFSRLKAFAKSKLNIDN